MVVLEFLKAIIDNFGSAIVVPFIIFIIALIFRVKPAKAFLSALYAGVSLEGFSLIIGAYTPIITPLVQNMSKVMSNVTGVELNTFDVGWQATSVVAFATSAGMIYLGLGIALQTILFLVKWTNIFQPSDLWNNYSYIVWGAMVIFKTHNFALGIACMVLLNLYSLLISELVAKRWSKYYNYPNCTIIAMHNVEPAIFAIAIDPILNLLGLNKVKLNPKSIEKKLGFIGEPMTLGFILGGIIGILGNVGKLTSMAGWGSVFTAAIATAAIMAIFPKIASMFAQAFAPITEAARVFMKNSGDREWYIAVNDAVGSGTVHDITRFHAYEMKIPFFSVPTAASVDGFVSTVAAMTWHGFKKSFTAVSPVVVIADTDIFKKAPLRLTASGVSDLLGKYTALADWKITHLLTGEYICKEICDMEYQALDSLISSLDGLKTGDTKAYEDLMYGLLLSGLAMQMTGNSRPASGAEHHMSHLWEMEVLNDYIDFYHGEKVGVGLVLSSKIYHKAAEKMLAEDFKVKDAMPIEEDLIREKFNKPGMFDIIMEENTPNLLEQVDPKKLIEHKEEIAAIINEIPTDEELIAMINKVEGVKSLEDLGFDESYQAETARLSPYVRARITFMRLLKFYDFYEEVISC